MLRGRGRAASSFRVPRQALLVAELRGRHPLCLFEERAEVALIGEAQAVGYLGDAEVGVQQQFFRFFYLALVDVFACSHARCLFELVVERGAAHGHFVLQELVVEVGLVDVAVYHVVQAGYEAQLFLLVAFVLGQYEFVFARHALLQQPCPAGAKHDEHECAQADEPGLLPGWRLDMDVEQLHGLAPAALGAATGKQGVVAGLQGAQFHAPGSALEFAWLVSFEGVVEEVFAKGGAFIDNHFEADG